MMETNWRQQLKSAAVLWIIFFTNTVIAASFQVQDSDLGKCLSDIANSKQWVKAHDFSEIKCHGKGIKSLVGLEQFSNLKTLSLYNNKLEMIDTDLSKLQSLKQLNLARNNLKNVIITDLTHLDTLYLFANRIKTLRLSNLVNLHTLKANNNRIETFIYSNSPLLSKIYIFNNQLETINIYDLPALQYMDCRENPMPDALYDEMDKVESVTFLHDGNAEDW